MNTQLNTLANNGDLISNSSSSVLHIGWMRTGTTFLQGLFGHHPDIHLSLKNRFFSYDPFYEKGSPYYHEITQMADNKLRLRIDSDENYSMGRFKSHLRELDKKKSNLKSELSFISHDIPRMIQRIKETAPDAKILGVIRKQEDWLESVYKHDVYNFAIDQNFSEFYHSSLGEDYRRAANYLEVIEQLWNAFGKQNVKILLFEDFRTDQKLFLQELNHFLNINLSPYCNTKLNKNASPDNAFTALYRSINHLSQTKPHLPENSFYLNLRKGVYTIERAFKKYNIKANVDLISKELKAEIFNTHKESNQQLAIALDKVSKMGQYDYF